MPRLRRSFLILKLAKALGADADELLILAKKIPPQIRKRVLEWPEAFAQICGLNDKALDRLVAQI